MDHSLQLAAHVDSAVALAMSRVLLETLRSLSPEAALALDTSLRDEIARLSADAELYADPISGAAAAVLQMSAFPIRPGLNGEL